MRLASNNQGNSPTELRFLRCRIPNFPCIILAIFLNGMWMLDLCKSPKEQTLRHSRLFSSTFAKLLSAKSLDQIFSKIKWTTWEFLYSDFISVSRDNSGTRMCSRYESGIHIINKHLLIIHVANIYLRPRLVGSSEHAILTSVFHHKILHIIVAYC